MLKLRRLSRAIYNFVHCFFYLYLCAFYRFRSILFCTEFQRIKFCLSSLHTFWFLSLQFFCSPFFCASIVSFQYFIRTFEPCKRPCKAKWNRVHHFSAKMRYIIVIILFVDFFLKYLSLFSLCVFVYVQCSALCFIFLQKDFALCPVVLSSLSL